MDNKDANKRIAKNTLALYLRMFIQMLIGLYTSRVILNALGVSDFGIYNVVGSVTAMLSFINGAMSNATVRYITFELGKGDEQKENEVFCIAMNIHIFIAFLTSVILEFLGVWFLYNKMVIPPDRLNAAFWVLQFSIITTIISIISVPYNACIVAHEKMGAFAFISLIQQGVTLALALFLPLYSGDRLIMYAIILMAVQLFIRYLYGRYCTKNFREVKYKFIHNRNLTIEMAKFAGLTMNGNIAWLGYTQGLNVLINLFAGTVVNAARGVAFTVQSKIVDFCNNFQTAIVPQITKSYAQGDFHRMHSLIINSSKLSFYLLLVLSFPIYIEIEEILKLWLKIVPEHTVNFVRIILLCSVIDVLRNPMNTAVHATGQIKKYQLIEATTLLLIVPVAYLFLYLGCPPESAFIVQLVIFIIVQIERVFIVCPQINMKKISYLNDIIKPISKVLVASVLVPVLLLIIWPIQKDSIIQCALYLIVSFASAVLSVYFVGLSSSEKAKAKAIVKKTIAKFHH